MLPLIHDYFTKNDHFSQKLLYYASLSAILYAIYFELKGGISLEKYIILLYEYLYIKNNCNPFHGD